MIKFRIVLAFLLFFTSTLAQQKANFDLLKGNSQEILTSYFDRDSAMLFTYDKAGTIVVWDVNNMMPIKRFNTIPANIWRAEANYEMRTTSIRASKTQVWVTSQKAGMYAVKQGSYSVYDRDTGAKIAQSDTTSGTTFIHQLNNKQTIEVYCGANPYFQNGRKLNGTISLKEGNTVLKKFSLPGLVNTIKVSDNDQFIALGYRRGGVDVINTSTFERVLSSVPTGDFDEVSQIAFLKENKGIVYSYERTGAENVYLHKFGETKPTSITFDKDEREIKIEVAPSGRYLAIFNPYKAGIYNLETAEFETKNLLDSVHIRPNAITFLTDELLLMAGVSFADMGDLYSVGSYEKAALLKVNWKTHKSSANLSYDYLNRTFINAQLTLVNDSTFKVNGRTGKAFQHLVDASQLKNVFSASTGLWDVGSVIENDAQSTVAWYLNWDVSDSYKLYKSTEESQNDTIFVAKVKKIANSIPVKIHSDAALVLWQNQTGTSTKQMMVTDYKGKILYKYESDPLFEHSFKFSPDGKFIAYQPNITENIVVPTSNFAQPKRIATGLPNSYYMPDQLYFDLGSTKIAYRTFNPANMNNFTYLAMELKSGKTDTLCKLNLIPYSYSLSGDFKRLALSLPLNFTDTVLYKDQAKMQEAARYGFKNLYQPNIVLMDTKADTTIATFLTKNNLMPAQILVTSKSVIALQEDGLFYHYQVSAPEKAIAQWLYGPEQLILNNNYYYGSAGVIDRITLKIGDNQYPAGEQDRFYNKPHVIMKDLGSNKTDLIKLYAEAFNKRLKQYVVREPNKTISNLAQLNLPSQLQQDFYTKDSVLQFTASITKGSSEVKKILVKVNDYSIYGKNGLILKPGQQQIKFQLPLDPQKNTILIQGIDAEGRYLKPVSLNYFADYQPGKTKRKLFILTVGVSKYADSSYNLKYAAKDAQDFAKVFSFKNNFDTIIVNTLTNESVNVKNFVSELKKANALSKNDVVMVFLAGHGMLDDQANFFFATHAMDFKNPQKSGLAYETVLDALEELPSRYKLLLVDACHSGLLDRSHLDPKPIHQTNSSKVTLQDQRGVKVINSDKGTHQEDDVFLFMQKVFNNMAYDNHVNIFSASLGNSYALENDSLQNGLFTYSLIKGIGLAQADPRIKERKYGESSLVNLNWLSAYLTKEVKKLSSGKQTPTFSLSKSADWILFTEPDIAVYTFDLDYKPTDPKDYKPSKAALYRQFLERYKTKL